MTRTTAPLPRPSAIARFLQPPCPPLPALPILPPSSTPPLLPHLSRPPDFPGEFSCQSALLPARLIMYSASWTPQWIRRLRKTLGL